MNTLDEIPTSIKEAATHITNWMTLNGWENWELMGIADRNLLTTERTNTKMYCDENIKLRKQLADEQVAAVSKLDQQLAKAVFEATKQLREQLAAAAERAMTEVALDTERKLRRDAQKQLAAERENVRVLTEQMQRDFEQKLK